MASQAEPDRSGKTAENPRRGMAHCALASLEAACRVRLNMLAERPRHAATFLVALCLAAYLPGLFALPPIDRTEVRYAQVSKQMLETGDFIAPRFQQHPQFTKPIGIFWLQAASAALFGNEARTAIWAYRLPSFFAAIFAVLITYWGARRSFGARPALLAAALLAVNLFVVVQAHLALSKAILLAFTALAQWSLARIYLDGDSETGNRDALLFWAAQGCGVLIGVLALPIVSLATIIGLIVLDRRADWLARLKPLAGLPLMILIASPWLAAMALNPDDEGLRQAWSEHFWSRLAGPQEMNFRAPPGIYVLGLWLGFLAAMIYLPAAARWLMTNRTEAKARYLLSWIASYIVVLELFFAKPPLYTVQSVVPAAAMAIALALCAAGRTGEDEAPAIGWPNSVFSFLTGILPASALGAIIFRLAEPEQFAALVPVVVIIGATVAAVYAAREAFPFAALALGMGAALLFYLTAFQLTLPGYERIWTSARLAEAAAAIADCVKGPGGLAAYPEPSAVFLLGTHTEVAPGGTAGSAISGWLMKGHGDYAFIAGRAEADFKAAQAKYAGARARKIGCIDGLNFGRFEWIKISLYTTAGPEKLEACPLPARLHCPGGDK